MLTSIFAPVTLASSTTAPGHSAAVLPFTEMAGRLESNSNAAAVLIAS